MGKLMKLCGLKSRNQVVCAIREGIDFMGVVFAEKSHRYMGDNLDEVKEMARITEEKAGIKNAKWGRFPLLLGIFQRGGRAAQSTVAQEAEYISKIVKETNLHGAQLYGYSTQEYDEMKACLEVPMVIFSVSVSTAEEVKAIQVPDHSLIKAVCVDNKVKDAVGGTGESFDWTWLKDFTPPRDLPLFLAGGINLSNVPQALAVDCADVLDISSGAEINKTKDGVTVRKLARAIRSKIPSYIGRFGGQFLPEILMPNLIELEAKYIELQADPAFTEEVLKWNREYSGRPTLLYDAERLTSYVRKECAEDKGAKIWLKREDLLHGGAHKINNGIGQALVAKALGKNRIIAETGAGQHGVATATVCALFGMNGTVYMGEKDTQRQRLNVLRIESMGAKVVPATSGARTLNSAVNEALRDWAANPATAHYLIGSVVGPHPFPTIVRDFQSVISTEARKQFMDMNGGSLPGCVVACVGGGSNCIGAFDAFVCDDGVELLGVEAGGDGAELHSSTLSKGTVGWLHGAKTQLLQTEDGQVMDTHSISAGLDYPAVGPEHSYLQDTGRATYVPCTDDEALEGFKILAKTEAILPALESSHAIFKGIEKAKTMGRDEHVVICVSGRGDKDMETIAHKLGFK
eukprot:TRINITY_DN713_c0_g2_i1.p1 TRINITY_DN713_c0_g2~~TRINITY_DN713_c0_g2_i1.p1  ORF type:complete len:632 (+),score=193.78 TRINITY_DN713_c0_g2_i1:246-2141(+)